MPDVAAANPVPCSRCPWRLENQGKPHPHGFYTKTNLRRLWTGLRRGHDMSCHPTDPRMAEYAGYEDHANRDTTHECAGALILKIRELRRFEAIIAEDPARTDTLKEYRRRHPRGLTQGALAELVSRVLFAGTPLGGVRVPDLDLNAPVGYEPLGPWSGGVDG